MNPSWFDDGDPITMQARGQAVLDATDNRLGRRLVGDTLTLRDYFAGRALAECMNHARTLHAGETNRLPWSASAAEGAYAVADAMLAEREKPR